MSFARLITRTPAIFDPDRGAEIAGRFAETGTPLGDLVEGTAGCSPYLKGLMEREADWFGPALDEEPDAVMRTILQDMRGLEASALGEGLRTAKRRAALIIAVADLGGIWRLEQVTQALTDLADTAVDLGLRALVRAEATRGKLPGIAPDDAKAGGMVVIAMGKMGAKELNYSSDIDLICLFDGDRYGADDFHDARAGLIRVTRRLSAMLSDLTAGGYVFRTDLRLRPDAAVTPVCISTEAAESYYESVGRTWERAAYIKARAAAGDVEAGTRFLAALTPFVWRKHLDFAAIQDAHDMRLRIREHKGYHGMDLPGHDMKLGPGGIREIEFFTQTRQLIAGGRDADLRVPDTVTGLARLADKGWVEPETARQLTEDYRAHREVEHRLQMIDDMQTQNLPTSEEGFDRLAAMMGRDASGLKADLGERLERVHEMTEGFFAPRSRPARSYELTPAMAEIVGRWAGYPALRSERAGEIFHRLKPEILSRLERAAKPEEALIHLDGFLAGLPAGVQLFSLFDANPQLIDLIIDIAATAPGLARHLGRNSQVLDAVIGGGFFADWPGREALEAELGHRLSRLDDYEKALDDTRRWTREWHFRIGVHHLRGLIGAVEAGQQYADLAGAVLATLWPVVVSEFAAKHGKPPGQGATILGMGSLGAERLTAASDLDLIVIYDAEGEETSEGRRPLAARTYYARLTQALVTALTAPMAEGRLYEVDMRLRPSGRQGPVATSFAAFRSYQMEEAWTWEHLALTRARPVAGEPNLGRAVEAFRLELLGCQRDAGKVLADVAEMRERIAAAKVPAGDWDAKIGSGRLQDVDLIAQTSALLAGASARGTLEQLDAGRGIGWLTASETEALVAAHDHFWALQAASRLLTEGRLDPEEIGQGGTEFLLRETGAASAEALTETTERLSEAAARTAQSVLGRRPECP